MADDCDGITSEKKQWKQKREGVTTVTVPKLTLAVAASEAQQQNSEEADEGPDDAYDPHYEPVITLPLVETKTCEEDERVLWSDRAKLYRFTEMEDGSSEWKERGTGTLKILHHRERNTVRLVMRRDQTLKVCANHYILPEMELRNHVRSDRAWLWSTPGDVSDDETKTCLFAARFRTPEIASEFRSHFNEGKTIMLEQQTRGEEEEVEKEKIRDEEAQEICQKIQQIQLKSTD